MGKSPVKWIKTIIFGKKSSKSCSRKKTAIWENEEAATAAAGSKTPSLGNTGSEENTDNGLTQKPNADLGKPIFLDSSPNNISATTTTITDQQDVITAQAICRGYLAQRSVGGIKGITRLQAVIRGRLVRRQAVSTLRCVQGIVGLQALFRGRRVRVSDVGREVREKCSTLDHTRVELSGSCAASRPDKLSPNAFICKLLASSPNAMPLHLHNDTMEPTKSTWQWLERWSSSKFWKQLPQPKNTIDKKSYSTKGNIQTKKAELGRQKKVERWVSTLSNKKPLSNRSPGHENQTNNIKNSEVKEESERQEYPKNELERVKQNLRRISASSKVVLASSQSVVEIPKLTPKVVSSSPTFEVLEKSVDLSLEKTTDPLEVMSNILVQKQVEMPPFSVAMEQKFDKLSDDHAGIEKHPLEYVDKAENVLKEDEKRAYKEDKTSILDFHVRSNNINLPGKLEYTEFVSQKSPSLPNYMVATESAKAKLKGFSSPRLDQDEVENGGFTRRHSLPLSTDRKFSFMPPQNEKLIQASAGGESRLSLSSSTNGHAGKGTRPGWRR